MSTRGGAVVSIRRRSKGSWEIRWDDKRGQDGTRRPKSKTIRGTKKAALAEYHLIQADLNKSASEKASETSVKEVCRRFLEERIGVNLRQGTAKNYRSFFKHYLWPECGDMPVGKVDRTVLQAVINRLMAAQIKPRTVAGYHVYMKGLFSWAVKSGCIPKSPVKDLTVPDAPYEGSGDYLLASEVDSVLRALEGGPFWLPTLMAVYTGMRPGEVLGLCWEDVDLDNSKLHVRRTLLDTDGPCKLGPAKTIHSVRQIAISSVVVEALREQQNRLPASYWCTTFPEVEGAQSKSVEQVDFRQVCAQADGRVIRAISWRAAFYSALESTGIKKVRLHDLRHTHVSILIDADESIFVISKRIGHADTSTTTRIYGHLLPTSDPGAAAKIERALDLSAQ